MENSFDFELNDLKRKAFNIFGDDASVELCFNFDKKVFNLQVPNKKIYLAGLTYGEFKFYLYGYADAKKD